jgi:hypothetical protein
MSAWHARLPPGRSRTGRSSSCLVQTEQSYRPGSSVIGEEVLKRMTRRVGEAVEVRVAGDPDDSPMSFLWRGRLYVVRAVLGHWHERREWWAAAAARALHGDESAPTAGGTTALDHERDVWRVEASAGRSFGNGVYDLCRDPGDDPSPKAPAWCLVQVAD